MEVWLTYWRHLALTVWGVLLGGVFLLASQELAALGAVSSIVVALILLQRPQRPQPRVEFEQTNEVDFFRMSRARDNLFRLVRGEALASDSAPGVSATAGRCDTLSIGRQRPVDTDAIIENEIETLRAHGERPKAISMMIGLLPPSSSQVKRYEEEVIDYSEALRDWLKGADRVLRERATELELAPSLSNDASVDALGGHLEVVFPEEFAPADQPSEPADPPERPNPPVGRPLSSLFDISSIADRQRVDLSLPLHSFRPELVRAQPRDGVHFRRRGDRRLVASCSRRTIRHREIDRDAPSLSVACPGPGEYIVEWFIHAENLPSAARGTLAIEVLSGDHGDPIESLQDLMEALGLDDEEGSAD